MSSVARLSETFTREEQEMAGTTSKGIFKVIVLLLGPIIRAVTPAIEEELEKFALKLYAKAEATDNPIDDLFVGMLLDMLDIPRPE